MALDRSELAGNSGMSPVATHWSPVELRITYSQYEFLLCGRAQHWSQPMAQRTEDSLCRRKMLGWRLKAGKWGLWPTEKGRAAIDLWESAHNDNRRKPRMHPVAA